MSLGTSNRDGGKTSESGHLRALAKLVSGDVIEGLAASQRAAGINMSVDVAVGDAFVRRSDGSYAHPVFNDAVYNQVISAADGSNPRRDIVVIYVDYGQSPSTLVSNNTNGVVKIKVVNGTPAGSPADPNDAAIQSSVGAGNPWTKLARVRVPAGQTSISNSLIDDLRSLIKSKPDSVDAAALMALAVTFGKIDFTSFPSAFDQTNAGSAEGTYNYIKLGSIVVAWGNTANYPSSSSQTARNIVFAAGIFTEPGVAFAASSSFGGTAWEYAAFNPGNNTLSASNTTLSVAQTSTSGAAVQGKCNWIIIGRG